MVKINLDTFFEDKEMMLDLMSSKLCDKDFCPNKEFGWDCKLNKYNSKSKISKSTICMNCIRDYFKYIAEEVRRDIND